MHYPHVLLSLKRRTPAGCLLASLIVTNDYFTPVSGIIS